MNLAEDLQEVTERINPLILRAEKALSRLFALPATVALPRKRTLVYEQGLLLVALPDGQTKRLTSASRETRLDALNRLPALVQALEAEKAFPNDRAQTVIDQAEAFLERLRCR